MNTISQILLAQRLSSLTPTTRVSRGARETEIVVLSLLKTQSARIHWRLRAHGDSLLQRRFATSKTVWLGGNFETIVFSVSRRKFPDPAIKFPDCVSKFPLLLTS